MSLNWWWFWFDEQQQQLQKKKEKAFTKYIKIAALEWDETNYFKWDVFNVHADEFPKIPIKSEQNWKND